MGLGGFGERRERKSSPNQRTSPKGTPRPWDRICPVLSKRLVHFPLPWITGNLSK